MFKLELKADKAILRELKSELPSKYPQIVRRGLNRTSTTVRSAAVKSVASELGIKQRVVREQITLEKAKASNLVATLGAPGRGIPAIELKPRPSKVIRPQPGIGVSYQVGSRKRKLVVGAFIARVRNRLGVWQRVGEDRWPSRHIRGPSIGQALLRRNIKQALRDLFSDRFAKEVRGAIKFFKAKVS